jgi:hypothetical protein
MVETFNAGLSPDEEKCRQLCLRRKELKLTQFDLMLIFYLINLSYRRIFLNYSVCFLAETLHEPYNKVAASIHKFKALDLVRKVTFKKKIKGRIAEVTGLMVSPFYINNGSRKRKAFKVKVWNEGYYSFIVPGHS